MAKTLWDIIGGKSAALIGLGDIGMNVAKRMIASDMNILGYDPCFDHSKNISGLNHEEWPLRIEEADFIVITCSLTESSKHMINETLLMKVKPGVRLVNVGRGSVIDEGALEAALRSGEYILPL